MGPFKDSSAARQPVFIEKNVETDVHRLGRRLEPLEQPTSTRLLSRRRRGRGKDRDGTLVGHREQDLDQRDPVRVTVVNPEDDRAAVVQGVADGLIRVSTGVEGTEDLVADFERALAAV